MSPQAPQAFAGRLLKTIGLALYVMGAIAAIIILIFAGKLGGKIGGIRPWSALLIAILQFVGSFVASVVAVLIGQVMFVGGKLMIAARTAADKLQLLTAPAEPVVLYLRSFAAEKRTLPDPRPSNIRGSI